MIEWGGLVKHMCVCVHALTLAGVKVTGLAVKGQLSHVTLRAHSLSQQTSENGLVPPVEDGPSWGHLK